MQVNINRSQIYRFSSIVMSVTFVAFFISGCAKSNLVHSQMHVTGVPKTSNINIYYIERNFLSSTDRAKLSPTNKTVTKFGYFEIGSELLEVGPKLFDLNGLTGNFQLLSNLNIAPDTVSKLATSSEFLVLEFTHGRIHKQDLVESIVLMLKATLYDETGTKRIWSGLFGMHLGNDPALGLLKTTRVDQKFIQNLLALVLEEMAKKQLVELPNGKLVLAENSSKP